MTADFFPTMPEPGAIEFIDEPTEGFTEDEAYAFLSGGTPYLDVIVAAAEVHTGAMIAFIPSSDDLAELVLDGEDTEPLEELHCTAIYLGDADEYDDEMRATIHAQVAAFAAVQPVVRGDVFGYSVWNPDTPDACLVADVGGIDLEDAQNALVELCDDLEIGIPDQNVPYRPHVTLAYAEDPRTLMTDELMTKTGPATFDVVRVAFGGVVTDYPLGAITASGEFVFHLAGQHDQSTHGRGGLAEHASAVEVRAAQRLNNGKRLDTSDPEQAQIASSIGIWTRSSSGPSGIAAAIRDPHSTGADAAFVRTVAAAPPDAPTLYRGMHSTSPHQVPQEGDVFDLGPTSFTSSRGVADDFMRPYSHAFGTGDVTRMKVKKKSRALRVDKHSVHPDEKEYVGMGRYRVTSTSTSTITIKSHKGDVREVTLHEIEIEQVSPDAFDVTRAARPPMYEGENPWG